MSAIPNNKLKLEVKSNEAEVAKFISTENKAELVFIPSYSLSQEQAILSTKVDASSSNIFQVSASIATDTTQLATFKYTNTDLSTTAIIKGNLIIDGSALSLGTAILTDENDNAFSKIMPTSPYSNLITERYTSLLYSNISQTSNTISSRINTLYNRLDSHMSNLFNIQRLFAGINFTSFSDADFDARFLTRTTDNLQNGSINNFIINKTHPNKLVVNAGLNASNLITKSVDVANIYANKFYADGSKLQNILHNNGIDGTTNTIPELPNASNLYYNPERVIPIIDASNILVSNYATSAIASLLQFNTISEVSNSNLIYMTSNEWYTRIYTDDYAISNAINADSLTLYDAINANNLYISNIIDTFNIDVAQSIVSRYASTSNYIFSTSNELLYTLTYSTNFLSTYINNLDTAYQQDTSSTSNIFVYAISNASNQLITSLLKADADSSNAMWDSSNLINTMILQSLLNSSNNISNLNYWLDVNLHSNLLATSNILKDVFSSISNSLTSEVNSYTAVIAQTTTDLDSTRQIGASGIIEQISNTFDVLSNLAYQSSVSSSNELQSTSNEAYNNHISLLDKLATLDIPDSCNTVALTSNDIRNYIFANFMNQFADISADITVISDNVNQRIDALTTDIIQEGSALYFTSNLFKSKIRALSLDDIKQGTQMKYITNNVYEDDLTISAQLSASNLTVIGTETMLMTNTINTNQLEIVSSAFNTALTVKQAVPDKNILQVSTNDNIAMIVTQTAIGIKTTSPAYALDVAGTLQATAFVASAQYLQNVNLADKTTADLAEHPTHLYYTPERAGLILSYCNMNVSNYAQTTSNTLCEQRNSLIASTIAYADITSNVVSTFINAQDAIQSNYVNSIASQLQQYAYTNILNENQSNYVRRSAQILTTFMINNQQSEYLKTTSNLTSNLMIRNHINISNYVYSTCNFNIGQQWQFSSNTSNNIRLTSNALINQFNSIIVPQINYSSNTSNILFKSFAPFDADTSNYVLTMSNIMSAARISNNMNNSNYISSTSNNVINYIKQSVINLQTSGAGTVSASATYINRWQEPTNYITNSTIATLPFNYITYNDGTAVGIGITNPTATLEIYTTNAQSNSIKVNNHIWAQTGIITSSDARIKMDIQDIEDSTALKQILGIEPKIYNYIDPRRQRHDVYGFIAQQVKEVIPNAVRIQTACIPDMCCEAMLYDNVLMFNQDVPAQLNENDKIGIYYQKEEYQLLIEDIYSENTYRVDNVYNLKGSIFIYGHIVDDFHTIDKDYIYTLNVCATQDLHRRQESMYDSLYNLKSAYKYNELELYNQTVDNNMNIVAYIPEKIKTFNTMQSNLQDGYMRLFDIKRQLSDVIGQQSYDVRGHIQQLYNANNMLKTDNTLLEANNSNLRNMIETMSDRITYIRGVLQRNNII